MIYLLNIIFSSNAKNYFLKCISQKVMVKHNINLALKIKKHQKVLSNVHRIALNKKCIPKNLLHEGFLSMPGRFQCTLKVDTDSFAQKPNEKFSLIEPDTTNWQKNSSFSLDHKKLVNFIYLCHLAR